MIVCLSSLILFIIIILRIIVTGYILHTLFIFSLGWTVLVGRESSLFATVDALPVFLWALCWLAVRAVVKRFATAEADLFFGSGAVSSFVTPVLATVALARALSVGLNLKPSNTARAGDEFCLQDFVSLLL